MDQTQWKQVVNRKRSQLDAFKIPQNVDTDKVEQFEAHLDAICKSYAARGVTRLVRDKLAPHLHHINSFTQSITSSTQIIGYAGLVWGGILAVIEAACRFSESLDNTFDLLTNFHILLPHCQDYIEVFPCENALQQVLRLLFEDTLDFYLLILKNFSRSPWKNLIRQFYSSSYKRGLEAIRTRVDQHRNQFETKAALVSRKKNEEDHAHIISQISPEMVQAAKIDFPIYEIPYRRNPKFFGRDAVLQELHCQLYGTEHKSTPISSVLHGMGGVGKTQAALEYTYRYRESYQCVFWLPAEDSVGLSTAYCAIGRRLRLFHGDKHTQTGVGQIDAVQRWLSNTDKTWLLVFDNAEDWKSIAAYWPTSSRVKGSIVVTCQRPGDLLPWTDSKIAISHFDVNSGGEFLLRMLDIKESAPEEQEQSREISKIVDGLPVYLTHISGHISQTQSSLEEYLKSINRSSSIWDTKHENANWMYERTINTMFDVALDELSTGARHLIYVLSFLNPDGVPESILFPGSKKDRLEYLDYPNEDSFLEVIADLRQRQLVKRERPGGGNSGSILTIHRSLQEGIQNKLNRDSTNRSDAFLCALNSLRRLIPRPSLLIQAEPEKWEKMRAYLPQLLSLRRAYARSNPRILGDREFAEILFDVGMNMWDRGLTSDGKDVLLTAEEVLDSIGYEEMTPLRANIHLVLGVILDDIGISGRSEALERRKKALAIRQACFNNKKPEERIPEDDILLYSAINDLCGSYRQINEFDSVRKMSEKCYAKYKTWGDIDQIPYEYAKYYNDMSFERAYHNDNEQALEYSRRAWMLMGKADSFALHSSQYKVTWALRLYNSGQKERAIQELQLILNFRLKTVGRQNYLTLQSELALGILHYHENNFEEAAKYIREVLGPFTLSVLPDETITRAKYYLSCVLFNLSSEHREEASKLHKEAQDSMEAFIKLAPPDTSSTQPAGESGYYDYLVAAGLRLSIFKQKSPTVSNEPRAKPSKFGRLLKWPTGPSHSGSRSLDNLHRVQDSNHSVCSFQSLVMDDPKRPFPKLPRVTIAH